MIDCYLKMQQLPEEVKKVGASVTRLDCVSMTGFYEGLKPLKSTKGNLCMTR